MLKKMLLSSCVISMTLVYAIDAKTYVVNKNDSTEDMSMYVSTTATRNIQAKEVTCDDEIKFSKDDKYMIIESSQFKIPPFTLSVLDNEEKELLKTTLEKTDVYKFKIDLEKLSNIKIIKITNRYGTLQYCKKISYK